MKAWITKYALTKGIMEIKASPTGNPEMIEGPGSLEYYHGEGRDWHRTRESALERAEVMRTNMIISLEKRIKNLRKMEWI